MEKLKIENAEIVFANLVEEGGFGTSLTIKLTPETEKQIIEFWKEHQIGKTGSGVPSLKEYTDKNGNTSKQFGIAFNEMTKFAGLNGLTKDDLGFGARVNFFIVPFKYNNKFTAGKDRFSANISAVVILSGRKTGADADLSELLGDPSLCTAYPAETAKEEVLPTQNDDLPF